LSTTPTSLSYIDVARKLHEHRISPIGLDDVKEKSAGWCRPNHGDAELSATECVVEGSPYLHLCLRVDEKKIPGSTFRIQVKQALEELAGANPSDGTVTKRIPKKLRDALRERIKAELLKACCPNTKLFSALWDTHSGTILFDSTSKAAFDTFEELFVATFAMPLLITNAGTLLAGGFKGSNDLQKLCKLVPAQFIIQDEVSHDR
jgi:DNA recombination-dependent growth factor C